MLNLPFREPQPSSADHPYYHQILRPASILLWGLKCNSILKFLDFVVNPRQRCFSFYLGLSLSAFFQIFYATTLLGSLCLFTSCGLENNLLLFEKSFCLLNQFLAKIQAVASKLTLGSILITSSIVRIKSSPQYPNPSGLDVSYLSCTLQPQLDSTV